MHFDGFVGAVGLVGGVQGFEVVESEHNPEDVEVEGGKPRTVGVVDFCAKPLPNFTPVELQVSVIFELDVPGFVHDTPL